MSRGRIKAQDKPTDPPSWADYWATVGNEDYLAARELAQVSDSIQAFLASFIRWDLDPVMVDDPNDQMNSIPDPSGDLWCGVELDWEAAAASYDEGLGYSSTEQRLLAIVLALVLEDRPLNIKRTLGYMGSWESEVWRILTEWGTGGRSTTIPSLTTTGPVPRSAP